MTKQTQETQGTQYESGIKTVEELAGYIPVKSAAAMFGDANENSIGYFIRKGKVDGLRIGGTILVSKKSWLHYWQVVRPQEEQERQNEKELKSKQAALDEEMKAQMEALKAQFEAKKAALANGSTTGK